MHIISHRKIKEFYESTGHEDSRIALERWYDIAQQAQWQETKHAVQAESDLEITGKDGVIVVRTTKRIQVRVFTILGQLVSQSVVNPGESILKVNSRGIYIVRVDNRTFKVAL